MNFADVKSLKKLVKELHDKKARAEHGMFLVEGEVSVLEFVGSDYEIEALLVSPKFLSSHQERLAPLAQKTHTVAASELEKLGTLSSNDQAIAVVRQKPTRLFSLGEEVVLALSDVNDPGNLGTIIRICDWYGIKKIVASKNTVDVYNSKVVSATKGSFARVQVYYEDLKQVFTAHPTVPVLGADLDGADVHTYAFPQQAFLLMGSESHGIHPDLVQYLTQKITIPRIGSAESLNVGVATAIILDNWMR